ncbi:uncharacterized protein LOC111343116 [Stylophora pistillata]|uniref:uncharacterized protein LOC111343116 n=1 Tax=Stylophora pistillata TaxID=50429 RepID=UPI000C03E3A7|nr:uncharacterized protein LOC111343116 [Stylophora pistillata]
MSQESGQRSENAIAEVVTKINKSELQKEKAALKVKIAFTKQEMELKLAKALQEQKLEKFELLRELELNKAKLNVCEETERTKIPSLDEDSDTLPSESQRTSPNSGLEGMATSLERCRERLAKVNVQQSTVIKQLFVSGQLPKITIPIFSSDPLQYPVWTSAFNALVDSRLMEADIKLNMLNQFVTGKRKQVMEHYLLIGTEDAYQKAKSILQERYGNFNVVSTALISKLEKWPKIRPKDAVSLRELSGFLDKILAGKETKRQVFQC